MRAKVGRSKIPLACAVGAMLVPATALAQETSGDIIVTARRTEERLNDVPISITVFNNEQIDKRNVTDLSQLSTFTPSLQSNSRFGSDHANFAIRGFSQDLNTAPSVAIYFADVGSLRGGTQFQSGDGAGPGSFFDLQNVQILKGPQGTLFGRNTTGGAILLVPTKPTSRQEGYLEGSVGNYGMYRTQGALNLPLGDRARFRVAFDRMKRDGYQRNIGLGPKDLSDIDYGSVRGSLVVDLTPDLENYTIVTYTKSGTNGHTNTISDCLPSTIVGGAPLGAFTCAQIARERATGDFYTVSNSQAGARSTLESWQVINTTTWEASDALTIKNIGSYGQIINHVAQDAFGTYWTIPSIAEQQAIAAANPGRAVTITAPQFVGNPLTFSASNDAVGRNVNNQYTLTEEFQLQGRLFDNKLQWQAGVYYEQSRPLDPVVGTGNPNLVFCTRLVPQNGACSAPYGALGRLSSNLIRLTFEDVGVYAQGTYSLTDKLRLTGGIRYTHNRSTGFAQLQQYRFNTAGQVTARQCQATGAVLPCETNANQTTSAPTWVVDVDYKPVEQVLLYAKYSRGYRQGLANPQALPPNQTFGAEKLDAYEAGVKASWRGPVPGSLEAAGFYNDFRNQQLIIGLNGNTPATATVTTQAFSASGKSRIWGFEAEGRLRPVPGLDLSGGYTYLNTKLLSYDDPPLPPGFFVRRTIAAGEPLLLTPKHKWTATATYTAPFVPDRIGRLSIGSTYAFTGRQFANIAQNPTTGAITRFELPRFGVLNFNASLNDVGKLPVDISFFIVNALQKEYFAFASDLRTSLGFVSQTTGEPRMFGFRARYRFGG